MARRTYAEKHADQIRDGNPAKAEPKLEPLDKADVQTQILNPPTFEIKRIDGKVIKCKTKFGPADVHKRRVMDELGSLSKMVIFESARLSGDFDTIDGAWFNRNAPYVTIAMDRQNIQEQTRRCINVLSGETVQEDDIAPDELRAATIRMLILWNEMLEANSKAKNAR